MSEPRLISPMLDGCIIGQAISCHNGVRCCPAIRQSTGEKYIVKIISVPASQVQLEALLLTGAYENNDAAGRYFMEVSQDILKEKDILADLSEVEGFTPYLDAQIVPMEDGVGYEVFLISPYKRSVEKILASDTLTHLSVVNLGLDMCAALAASRRAGYLYVDLKPGNIFQTENQDYRIGDLGFIALSSLKFATLPEKYHSSYSPEEVTDPMAVLNDTVDIYALGLVLYQAYNGGKLPVAPMHPGDAFVPPMYADYEMAEIILKACAPKQEDRYADPTQMGQALVSYMQRNCVNDDPIIPPLLPVEEPVEEVQEIEEFLPEPEEEPEELAFLQELTQDDTAPREEDSEELEAAPLTEETSKMLAQADELIAVELPEPVVAPEPIEVPMPEPLYTGAESEAEVQEDSTDEEEAPQLLPEEAIPVEEVIPEDVPEEAPAVEATVKKSNKNLSARLIAVLLLLVLTVSCAALAGQFYYNNVYLQNIDELRVTGTQDMLTVHVTSDAEESLLTVIVTDSYGNIQMQAVTAGVAIFRDLAPQTRYTVRVEISGAHKLTGYTSTSFTTSSQTTIENFNAVIGPTDGSALLSFTVNGPESSLWQIVYSAEGVPEKTVSFTGHSVTVNDLMVGAEYTFRLVSADELYLNGQAEVTFKVSKVLFAEDLQITAAAGGSMTLVWNAPVGETVEKWTVHYYSSGTDLQTVETTDTSVILTGIDHSLQYTIEVFADGMSQSAHIFVKPDPITIKAFHFDSTKSGMLNVTWEFEGTAPAEGWIVEYTVNGLKFQALSVSGTQLSLPALPEGSYQITVRPAADVLVFGNHTEHILDASAPFEGYGITAADIQAEMCLRPEQEYWNWSHVDEDDFTNSYSVGQKAGVVLRLSKETQSVHENTLVTYTVHDSEGNLIHLSTATSLWSNIIQGKNGALNVPFLPETAGQYTLTIYFNGKLMTVQTISIV